MERKRKDRYLENGGSFNYCGKLVDPKHQYGDSSCDVFSSIGIHQHKQNTGPDSLSYMQTQIPCMLLDYSHPSDQISVCPTPSGNKSENNGLTSPSPKEFSYTSNPVQATESSYGPSFEVLAETTNETSEKLCQDLQPPVTRKSKHVNMSTPMVFCHPVSAQKQVQHSEIDVEAQSEVEGDSVGIPTDLDSSNVQESTCMSSVLDEISLQATNFRQLQQVMEQVQMITEVRVFNTHIYLSW
jgi:hypothetical protein